MLGIGVVEMLCYYIIVGLWLHSLFERSTVMSDVVPPQIPLVFHLLLANLTLKLLPNCMHIQNVLK